MRTIPPALHRPSRRRHLALATLAALVASTPTVGGAQATGPVFPPPGGVTFAGVGGLAIGAAGRTNTYRNFDDSQFGSLYWTFAEIANPRHSTQAPTGNMAFLGYDPTTGIATWGSTANVVYNSAFGLQSYGTRLRLQFQPYTGVNSGPIGSGWLAPTTAGAAGIPGLSASWPVLDVGNVAAPDHAFQAWYRFETTTGVALGTHYDNSHHLGGSLQTSLSGGFYYTATPEPGTVALVATALAITGVVARRRRGRADG